MVIAIIGILATIAGPTFRLFQAKARQAEVKTNLKAIYTLQVSYHNETEKYYVGHLTKLDIFNDGSIYTDSTACNIANDIGFHVTDCLKTNYFYAADNATSGNDIGEALERGLWRPESRKVVRGDGCGQQYPTYFDQWEVYFDGRLVDVNKALAKCF